MQIVSPKIYITFNLKAIFPEIYDGGRRRSFFNIKCVSSAEQIIKNTKYLVFIYTQNPTNKSYKKHNIIID